MARFRAGRSDCGELAAKAHISDPARESENADKACGTIDDITCGTIDDITCGTIDDIKGKSSQSVTRMLETESRDRVRSLPSLGASLCVMRDSWIGLSAVQVTGYAGRCARGSAIVRAERSIARAQPGRKHLAVHPRQLALQSRIPIL